jgi:hypothetical protein
VSQKSRQWARNDEDSRPRTNHKKKKKKKTEKEMMGKCKKDRRANMKGCPLTKFGTT